MSDINVETVFASSTTKDETAMSDISRVSSVSKASIASEKFDLKKKEAALKARLAFSERERQLKLQKLEEDRKRMNDEMKAEMLRLEREEMMQKLRLEREIAENQAVQNVVDGMGNMLGFDQPELQEVPAAKKADDLRKFLDSAQSEQRMTSLLNQPTPDQAAAAPTHAEPVHPESIQSMNGWEKISSTLERCMLHMSDDRKHQSDLNLQLAVSSQLPKISVPVFAGDPLQFPLWNNAFSALIDSKPVDSTTKLNYLGQFVRGQPKEVVDHYLLLGTKDAYQKARGVLSERYGNSTVISTSYINHLDKWPKISPKDGKSLREFSDFLDKVSAAKVTIPSLGVLDYPQENAKLLAKLPYYLDGKWRDVIQRKRSREGSSSYPTFAEFADYVKEAAEKANMPELECLKSETQQKSAPGKGSGRPSGRSFATSASPKGNQHGQYTSCPFCDQAHHLDDCTEFKKKSHHLKKAFFFQKMLCMGCAQTDVHRVKDCKERKKCKDCDGNHLTCLHREARQEASSNCTSVCSLPDQDGREHCMIVPVWVRHVSDPTREVLQYAILDDQSNVGFISEGLRKKLGVEGPDTQLLLTTMHHSAQVSSKKINGIEVLDFNKEHVVSLPSCYTRDEVPAKRSQVPKGEVLRRWSHLAPIADQLMPYNPAVEVSVLIGNNCPRAIRPREIIPGGEEDPYAQRSLLGWGVVGNVCLTPDEEPKICNRISASERHPKFTFASRAKETFDTERIIQILEQDFKEAGASSEPYSVEETRFMEILEKGIQRRDDGHYEMPLPLRSEKPNLPFNKPLAVKRWNQLSARLRKNPKFSDDYRAFMDDVILNYAERVPDECLQLQDRVNYIPHTGVYHPRKPDKIRVVFDCSAAYQGVSLNDHLLQGPNVMNSLLGVLCRFRRETVAVAADVKSMFHQFYVAPEDRDLLRFLWWEDGNPEHAVVEYRMKVHLFGAASSPGVATFGLRRAADDGEEEYGTAAANYIRTDFYVDDGLRSEPDVASAIQLLKDSQEICAKAGLMLHKIVSNRREVLKSFPEEERAKDTQNLDLDRDPLALERVLGVVWCIENDVFNFKIEIKDRPFTRRGVLSMVSSIYDPCGFLSPVMLRGKQILQELCRRKLDWDSPMPAELRPLWEKWLLEVCELEKLQIPRCFKPSGFGEAKAIELHHFSDASQTGYGQCSYVRLVNEHGKAHCTFVLGKSRVTPLRSITIPRLELAAATVSAKSSAFLRSELKYNNVKEYFWTDSKVVLGYIKNEARRFHVYVANRVQLIRDQTDPDSWFYVDTTENPADDASRGVSAQHLTLNHSWFRGPDFLWKDGVFTPTPEDARVLEDSDPEVKRATVLKTTQTSKGTSQLESSRLESFSSWHSAKKAVARCLQLKARLKQRAVKRSRMSARTGETVIHQPVTVVELQEAEKVIIRGIQQEHFPEELQALKDLNRTGEIDRHEVRARNAALKKTSALFRLDPFLDGDGIIRVGGRIDRANISNEIRHPVILPRKCHVSTLLIRDCHHRIQHMGRGITHNELRQKGYWVIRGASAVSQCISSCVTCRRMRGQLLQQKMAELPHERVEPSPPFSYCAVDYFGPFLIKERRSEVKRYGVLFTCMSSRSVHLETANSLSSSAFINALRRFMNRRGAVRQLRSDQGTMFVGARNELKEALSEMDQGRVQEYLLENGCDWIPFKMNVPHASHMGGVWERQIQSVRRALEPLLKTAGSQLDDEAFRTFMTEAEAIINSRPLTTTNLSDNEAPEPLTPHHILTAKPKVILPPPGVFQREDVYSRKWWRRVQHIANEFWLRWRKEYLQGLQTRQKWTRPVTDLGIGDIVISKESEGERYQWPLARVIDVYPSADGRVRKVKLLMADGLLDNNGRRQSPPTELDRPVHKLVRLLPTSQ